MQVLLMGAGGQGGSAASILSRDPSVEKIVIGDIDVEMAAKVADAISSDKIEVRRVDADAPEEIAAAAADLDVVMDLVTPKFYYNVLLGALIAKTNYVSASYDHYLWDNKMEPGKKPRLYEDFTACQKTAILGCGMSFGYTAVIARLFMDKCDTVQRVTARLAEKGTVLGEYVNGCLTEEPDKFAALDQTRHEAIMVEVTGSEGGKPTSYTVYIPAMEASRKKTHAAYGTSQIAAALPVVVGAKMLAQGDQPKGVVLPCDLRPDKFLSVMTSAGFVHGFEVVEERK